jgi:hypothetical protein
VRRSAVENARPTRPHPRLTCEACGTMLVDLTDFASEQNGYGAPPRQRACPSCESLTLADVVSQLWKRT